jgi:diaminohydroxyphosphoribosylaminopyrimidine deaminase/5-amino-6-(5-phosphoribosylamino)uracil reductase
MNDDALRTAMDRAVRLACRGHGGAEPNPMVGCVLVAADGTRVAEGFHARCGGPHAEADALAAAGARARGATAVVTLEPCAHRGRTGPCADALIEAGVARVVYAVDDPNPVACGGAERLRGAGIPTTRLSHAGADELARPFLKRVRTGLPWIVAKWAQTIDGAIALASGESKWISSERSRAMVHRERGRVDAILTGIGTVMADDPLLTARGGVARRTPRRIVLDPRAETPVDARVVRRDEPSAGPTTVLVARDLDEGASARLARLESAGVSAVPLGDGGELAPALRALAKDGVSTVLVEAGGGVLGTLLREGLVDEAWVFVAPILAGERDAIRPVRGLSPASMAEACRPRLVSTRRRGEDVLLQYRFR